MGGRGLYSTDLEQGQMAGFLKRNKEPPDSIKDGEFPD
jgi:hypothetical protein